MCSHSFESRSVVADMDCASRVIDPRVPSSSRPIGFALVVESSVAKMGLMADCSTGKKTLQKITAVRLSSSRNVFLHFHASRKTINRIQQYFLSKAKMKSEKWGFKRSDWNLFLKEEQRAPHRPDRAPTTTPARHKDSTHINERVNEA